LEGIENGTGIDKGLREYIERVEIQGDENINDEKTTETIEHTILRLDRIWEDK
jgi:hypothetical protein